MLQSWRSTGPICNTAEVMAYSCLSPLVTKPPLWMWVLRAWQSGISTEIFVFKAVCTLCIPWSRGIETSHGCSVCGQEVPWRCWIMKQTPARSFHISWSALHYTNGGVPSPQIWEEILETNLQEEFEIFCKNQCHSMKKLTRVLLLLCWGAELKMPPILVELSLLK